VRRARTSVWRRGAVWGAGVIAALLAAGGGWAQLAPAGSDGGAAPAPSAAATTDPPAFDPAPAEVASATAVDGRGMTTRTDAAGAASSSATGGGSDPKGVSATTVPAGGFSASASSGSDGPSEGCRVQTGKTESCSYVATRPGGYEANGTYRIVIERDGRSTVYDTPAEDQAKGNPCRDVGFILAGDRVTVSVPSAPEQWPTESPTVTGPSRNPPPPPPSPPPLGVVAVGPDAHC
jgi:hypothetical protein